jgi:GTP cyclohydrolase I
MSINLPDVTSGQHPLTALPLKWVGMEAIAIPLQVPISEIQTITVNAKADVFVSLDKKEAKGIHMSRLYIKLRNIMTTHSLKGQVLTQLLNELITSQQGLSESAKIKLQFELTLQKMALLSNEFGYQSYPVTLSRYSTNGKIVTELSVTIPYSSTCPCSSALSRQALSDSINQHFSKDNINKSELMDWVSSEQGTVATPHSQRSYAYIKLTLQGEALPNLPSLISEFETIIGTPVQTAVKREDEQAFAKLNAENLMFCEDAARKLKQALEHKSNITGYWFKIEHQESLHAHNAVVIDFDEQPYKN